MTRTPLVRRLGIAARFLCVLFLLALSALLLARDAKAVRRLRETGLPAAAGLPKIERRMTVLREQNEVMELQAMMRGGTQEELLRLAVLPDERETSAILAAFEGLFSFLQKQGALLSFSAVTVGDPVPGDTNALTELPFTVDAVLTEEGMETLLTFLDAAGLLTVSDVLTPAEIDTALSITEDGGPAAITALEHLLATDLLRYAEEHELFHRQLLTALPTPALQESMRASLDGSRLPAVRHTLQVLRPVLTGGDLWPMRFLTARRFTLAREGEGRLRVTADLTAYFRKQSMP